MGAAECVLGYLDMWNRLVALLHFDVDASTDVHRRPVSDGTRLGPGCAQNIGSFLGSSFVGVLKQQHHSPSNPGDGLDVAAYFFTTALVSTILTVFFELNSR